MSVIDGEAQRDRPAPTRDVRQLVGADLAQVEVGDVDLGLVRRSPAGDRERPELQRHEEPPDLVGVPLPHLAGIGVEVEVEIGDDARELLVEREPIAGGRDVLSLLALQLVDPRDERLDRAELMHELGGGLVADPRHARDVVGGVALQRDEVQVLGRA